MTKYIFATAVAVFLLTFASGGYAQHKGDPVAGAQLFAAFNCAMCHPGGGNTVSPEKPLKGPEFLKRIASDGALAKMIRTGSPGTAMKGFGKEEMSDEQLADIVSYIRSLSQSQAGATASKPGGITGSPPGNKIHQGNKIDGGGGGGRADAFKRLKQMTKGLTNYSNRSKSSPSTKTAGGGGGTTDGFKRLEQQKRGP